MNELPLGAPVRTKYNHQEGFVCGYQSSREKYLVQFDGGVVKELSGGSLHRAEKAMSGPELLDEIEFLLEQGQSPLLIPQIVHRHPDVVARMARKHKRTRVLEAFNEVGEAEYLRKSLRGFR